MTVKLVGSTSGSVSLQAPASTTGGAHRVLTLPDADGTVAVGSTGKVLQVVSATKLDTASTANSSGTTHVAIAGLQPQITPSAATSKVLVMLNCKFSISTANGDTSLKLFRSVGGTETEIFSGTAEGNRQGNIWGIADYNSTTEVIPVSSHYLDTPNTTSQITYILKWQSQAQAVYINRSGGDSNVSNYHRNSSSVILMEIAA
mgnify:FL=1